MIAKTRIREANRESGKAGQAHTNRFLLFILPVLLIFSLMPAGAQVYTGTLTGEVSDPSGAKVAGANITVTADTTHFVTKAVSNDAGVYSIPFLNPDTYSVVIEAAGFQTETRTGVTLTAGGKVSVDFALKVGSTSQNIVVAASSAVIDTSTPDLGTTFTAHQVTDMPNMGRVPFMVAALTAGAWDNGYMNTKTDTTLVPWGGGATATTGNGVGGGHTIVTIDGSPDNPLERAGTSTYGGYTGFTPSPESVQEVKMQTALYDAEYGHGGGTVMNTVLRSGANSYHGAFYYVFRNTYMDANTYERVNTNNPRVNETWNQPGGVLTGPVRIPHLYNGHDKTFFMVAYERISLRGTEIYGATDLVPVPAMANGDFSSLCPGGFDANGVCVAGGGVQIYDPLTLDAKHNRTPFKNNQILPNRWDPTGEAILKNYFPAPNANVSSAINYVSPHDTIPEKYFSFTSRLDEAINQNNKLSFAFYNQVLAQEVTNQGYPTAIGPSTTDDSVYRNNHGGSADYVSILPHSWVLDLRTGVIYHPFGVVYKGDPFDLSSISMNDTGLAYQTFPGISLSDSYQGLQAGAGSQLSNDTFINLDAIVSKTMGRHDLRFGFEGEYHRYSANNPTSGLGTFNFDRRFTQQNSVDYTVGSETNSGNPIASMLMGYPSSGSYANQISFAVAQPYQAYFFQDDWRATSKLTVNAGLRWDYEAPFTERYNRLSTGFCTTCANPLQAHVTGLTLNGGLLFASPSHRHYYASEYTNWQPRFGVSYRLPAWTRTVVHGGVGLIFFNNFEGPIANGFSASTSYIATSDNTHPGGVLSNPFSSGVNLPSGSSLGLATLIGQGFSFIAPNYSNPRNFQWSVSEQTQLPLNLTLQVAYVGNTTSDYEISKNINSLPANFYNQGTTETAYLQNKVTNPMVGLIPTNSTLNAATIQQQNLLLPFPEFGSLTMADIPGGSSLYNALQVTVNKPMGHRLRVFGSFTWSHMMESYQYLNATDPLPERYQDGSPTVMGNVYANYKLPDVLGLPKYLRMAAGGWQLNGVMRAYNGTLVGNPGSVTWLSNPHLSNKTYNRYFNTCYEDQNGNLVMTTAKAPACNSASDTPAFRQNAPFTLNTVGPQMSGVRILDHPLIDASLFKVFPIHESTTFEIRGEFFNVLNTPNFGGPNTSPGNAQYGQVTLSQQNDPRVGQLTARINF